MQELQNELNYIIKNATEHAKHISKSAIDHQGEHFDFLSKEPKPPFYSSKSFACGKVEKEI